MAVLEIKDNEGNIIPILAIKGDDGKDGEDGQTPYIQNGTWWFGDEDTGIKAEAVDGEDAIWWRGIPDNIFLHYDGDGKYRYLASYPLYRPVR